MEFTIISAVLLFIISFIAGFVDSIAGGGGLLMLPSLLIAGLQPQFALGTNKFLSSSGTSVAVLNFARKKKVAFQLALSGIIFALIGGFIGSRAVLLINQQTLGKIIIFLLPIAALVTLYPKKNAERKEILSKKDLLFKVPIICLAVGFYDGFFGPGTGSFLAILFYAVIGLGLIEATANAKMINLATNLGALISFMIAGKVIYLLAIPLALSNMAGNYLGSHTVLTRGEKVIKVFLAVVLAILLITLIWRYIL